MKRLAFATLLKEEKIKCKSAKKNKSSKKPKPQRLTEIKTSTTEKIFTWIETNEISF